MGYYSKLRFFDKSGSPANFQYDSVNDIWTGTLYYPRVSTGLYENQHLFIVEDIELNTSPSTPGVTFPVLGNQTAPTSEQWATKWESDENEDVIFTYILTTGDDGFPYIDKYAEIEYANAAVPYTLNGETKIIDAANSTPLKINIAFSSPDEDIYERTLIIEDHSFATPKVIAKIGFYGETVGEDERFRLSLENFGRTFDHEDELIIKKSDIKEPLPNWINTNEKRKELLLAGEEIYPYMGAYKGLINVVKFFGYQDLRIKEYWLNIDDESENFNKVLQYQLTGLFNDEYDPLINNPLVPNTVYKKTSMFGLFYDITVATGEVDENGLPLTENASMFSNEEVLIKLFALKKKLAEEFLPLNAKVVDIVGEGIYFERFGIRTWTDELQNFTSNIVDRIDFSVNAELGFIRDLRKFRVQRFQDGMVLLSETYTNTINPFELGQHYPADTVEGLIDSIEAYYEELKSFTFPYTGEKETYKGDHPGIPAGCPIILKGEAFAFTWDDMQMSWDSLSEDPASSPAPPSPYTWDTIDFSNYYEAEWTIELVGNTDHGYNFKHRGPILSYYNLPHFLPYSGKYKITLRVFDMFNNYAIQIKEDVIEVLDRQLEIAAFCRFRNSDDYSWNGTENTWDDLGGSSWHFPIEGESPSVSPITEKLLNWPRYKNQEDMQILNVENGLYEDLISTSEENAVRVGTRNLNWNNMDLPWDEMYHSTWDLYDYHGEFLGGFRFYSPGYGDTIQIDDFEPFIFEEDSPVTALTLQLAADKLNASINPGIRKFTYTVRHQPTASPTLTFIHATAKFPGADGWRFVKYEDNNSPGIYGDPYSFTKPTWLDTISIDDLSDQIDSSVNPAINIDRDLMFLQVPLQDRILMETNPLDLPRPDQYEYWEEKGFKKTEEPNASFPYGERRGELPSWYGAGSFTSNDLRVFERDFEIPLGVPLFLTHKHSEIPGKTKTTWEIINELTGESIIKTKDKPFLIITLLEESIYTVNTTVEDSNGNKSGAVNTGFFKVSSRANMGKPVTT